MGTKKCSSRQQDINYRCEACSWTYGCYVSSLFKELNSEDPKRPDVTNFYQWLLQHEISFKFCFLESFKVSYITNLINYYYQDMFNE